MVPVQRTQCADQTHLLNTALIFLCIILFHNIDHRVATFGYIILSENTSVLEANIRIYNGKVGLQHVLSPLYTFIYTLINLVRVDVVIYLV